MEKTITLEDANILIEKKLEDLFKVKMKDVTMREDERKCKYIRFKGNDGRNYIVLLFEIKETKHSCKLIEFDIATDNVVIECIRHNEDFYKKSSFEEFYNDRIEKRLKKYI